MRKSLIIVYPHFVVSPTCSTTKPVCFRRCVFSCNLWAYKPWFHFLIGKLTWFFFFFPGSKNSIDCTLILTEGDSAKTLAVSGLGVVGRDKYGVFPLRGKILNVREASHKQVSGKIFMCWKMCYASCNAVCFNWVTTAEHLEHSFVAGSLLKVWV